MREHELGPSRDIGDLGRRATGAELGGAVAVGDGHEHIVHLTAVRHDASATDGERRTSNIERDRLERMRSVVRRNHEVPPVASGVRAVRLDLRGVVVQCDRPGRSVRHPS